MVINLSLKGVPNRVTCPQVQVFPLMRNYKYLLTKFILFPWIMKYETWTPSMHWPWIIKDSKPSPSRDAQNSLTTLFPPLGISNMVTTPPMYMHITHHHNDIFNINNISSQCHYQHQHHLISMSFSTSISSHLSDIINIIINNNIISYQYYHKHQHHLVSIIINIIFNNNIILYQHYHKHQCHLISINIINVGSSGLRIIKKEGLN